MGRNQNNKENLEKLICFLLTRARIRKDFINN